MALGEAIKISQSDLLKRLAIVNTNILTMKKVNSIFLALAIIVSLSSCEVVGGIFKAGVWVGVLVVVGIIGLILYLVSRGRR